MAVATSSTSSTSIFNHYLFECILREVGPLRLYEYTPFAVGHPKSDVRCDGSCDHIRFISLAAYLTLLRTEYM